MQINARHAHSAKLPRGLTRCQLEPEASAMIQTEAIQHALQAVFLSGMDAAMEAMKS